MTLLSELQSLLGPSHVLTGADADGYVQDWRRRYRGAALAAVRPGSTDEVAGVVRLCLRHGVPVVPQGGNTGLCGGATPDASGSAVVLSTARLNRVRALDTDNDTITVEAGCVLQAVQEAAAEAGRLFPLSLAAEGSCTIGGNLATNAGGTQVLRYGNTRDLALGLEVVTADGEVWNGLRGLRKDNTGYDLRDLYIGSEGTLGIITAATLKLYPRPVASCTALLTLSGIDDAVELLSRARAGFGASLTGFELMSGACLQAVVRLFPQQRLPSKGIPPPRPGSRCWSCPIAKASSMHASVSRRCWERPSRMAGQRRGHRRQCGPEQGALASAREHPAGRGRAGQIGQARCLDPDFRHRRLCGQDQRAAAGALSRREARDLRPSGRRQSALQRGQCGRADRGRAAGAAERDLWRGA